MLNIGILRGGTPEHFDESLARGDDMLRRLREETYTTHDIFLSKEGIWHRRGQQMSLPDALRGIDVVVPALHAHDMAHGAVQHTLHTLQIPFVGSGRDASRRSASRHEALEYLRGAKRGARSGVITEVHMPPHYTVEQSKDTTPSESSQQVFSRFGPPYIVSPAHKVGTGQVRIATAVHELPEAIEAVMQCTHDSVVVEPQIRGKDASVFVVDGFRDQEHYTLPPVTAVIGEAADSKAVQCPAPFTYEVKKKLEDAAREVHKQLKLAHYSQIDFRVTPSGVYVIQAHTHPNIGEGTPVEKSLDVVGSSLTELYHHLIDRAYRFRRP